MPSEEPPDYQIGYKKPPLASRFKKGNNANPRGRPRAPKGLAAVLRSALDEPAQDEDGKRRRQTKREAVVRRLVEKSAGADLAATKLLFELLRKADPDAVGPEAADTDPLGQDPLELLKQKLARLASAQLSSEPPAAGPRTGPASNDAPNTTPAATPPADEAGPAEPTADTN
jgi:hypothetical protein